MSIMNQAKQRSEEIKNENTVTDANRRQALKIQWADKLASMPWMEGMPAAHCEDDSFLHEEVCFHVRHRLVTTKAYLFRVDDAAILIRPGNGYRESEDYYVQVPCSNDGCASPAWRVFSRYQSSVTLIDIMGKALAQNDALCIDCQKEKFLRRCPECGHQG